MVVKIKDLPLNERPYEKLINYGVSTLSNEELLAILIKSGTNKYSDFANVGAVAGIVSDAATFQGITVEDAEFDGSLRTDVYNVGGLIGYTNGGADIQNSSVSGAPISGYRNLGGLIGTAVKGTGATEYKFTATSTNVTFNQAITNNNTMDCWYAAIGGFIGACVGKPDVTLVGTGNTAAAVAETAFQAKKYVSSTSTSDGRFYNFERKQNFLGFSGRVPSDTDYGFGTVTINSVAMNVPAAVPSPGNANSLYIFNTEHTN